MHWIDSSSLKVWEIVSECGFVAVIIGVVGESAQLIKDWREHKGEDLPKKVRKRFLWMGTLFFVILVLGLAVEFIGSHKAMRIADEINASLHERAASAEERAGEAHKLAARANEGTAKAELDRVVLEKEVERLRQTNSVLRAKVLEIELITKPRSFSIRQIEASTSLRKYSDTRVSIAILASNNPENAHFRENLLELLKIAKWKPEIVGKTWWNGPNPTGVMIVFKKPYFEAANALNEFLNSCDIASKVFKESEGGAFPETEQAHIVVVIGDRQ